MRRLDALQRQHRFLGFPWAVLRIFSLLYLTSQTLVLSVEVSTVIGSRLSPRGLTNAVLTDTDRRALALQAHQQERVAGQCVTTTFAVASDQVARDPSAWEEGGRHWAA